MLFGHLPFQSAVHSSLLCSFLFDQPHSPTCPTPSPAWVMACVDFLSPWEVVLHGLPLSSCYHACPFNRLGNPSWYLYRPWFSWYSCSLPLLLLQSLPLCFSYLTPSSTSPTHPSSLCLSLSDNVFHPLECQSSPIHQFKTWAAQKLGSVVAWNKFCMVKQQSCWALLT